MPLTLTGPQTRDTGTQCLELLHELVRSSSERPVVPQIDRETLEHLRSAPFPDEGVGVDHLLSTIREQVVPNSANPAHPGFLAYVLGPSNGIAPFAEAIAAALNQNCNLWQLSPAANVIEQNVISWLSGLFAYPASAAGLMTSGGSLATLTAISAAIQTRGSDVRGVGIQGRAHPLVAYTSTEAHRCVEKAVAILGLGNDRLRRIPVDEAFSMRADALATAIEADIQKGNEPFCVIATAGTVNTGAIDPIDAVADVCARYDLWLHIDAAYGGCVALSRDVRDRLLPCRRADSIALDPHKLLFASLDAGALLVRDRRTLERAFRFDAPYLPAAGDGLLTNFKDYGIELSRGFRAFKVWCALRAFGVRAFIGAVEHACLAWGIRACVTNFNTRTVDVDTIVDRLESMALS